MQRKSVNQKLKFCILVPTYNGAGVIKETLMSILSQSYKNFEIIITDDGSKDNTEKVVKSIKDERIKFYKHNKNVGYARNLERGRDYCKGDILYLMGQDDILGSDALLNTYKAFMLSNDIGAVTRPYYWFHDEKIKVPVRAKTQLNPDRDEVVSIFSDKEKVISVFDTLDQLSGLAYRMKYMDRGFHEDIFPCHIYPFASIFKKHSVVFLKDYNIAVRIASSQTRFVSWIYDKSPMLSWVEMVEDVFTEKKYQQIKDYLIHDFIAVNYVGLVQLKNFSTIKNVIREIWYLVKFKPQNLLNPVFWFFSLGTILVPSLLLIPLVDWYKKYFNAMRLSDIKFNYSFDVK